MTQDLLLHNVDTAKGTFRRKKLSQKQNNVMLTPQRAHLKINLAKGKTRYVPGHQLQRPVANNSALYSNNSLLQLQQQFCILQLTFVVAITLYSNNILLQLQLQLCTLQQQCTFTAAITLVHIAATYFCSGKYSCVLC